MSIVARPNVLGLLISCDEQGCRRKKYLAQIIRYTSGRMSVEQVLLTILVTVLTTIVVVLVAGGALVFIGWETSHDLLPKHVSIG